MCQGLGTRQSDHLASHEQKVRCVPRPGTRRTDHCSPCAREKAHGEPKHFAVRQSTGHTAKSSAAGPRVTKVAVCLSRWRTAKWEISPCAYFLAHGEVFCHAVRPSSRRQYLFFAVYPWIHTANVFAVCPINGTRQTRPLPCLALSSGVRRRPPMAKTSPCAY